MNKNQLFRKIPKMDVLLTQEAVQKMINEYGYDSVRKVLRQELDHLRTCMEENAAGMPEECNVSRFMAVCGEKYSGEEQMRKACTELLIETLEQKLAEVHRPHLIKVLNGTGTILHTNLGRAPIDESLLIDAVRAVSGYSNLEYDLEEGVRGSRGAAIETLLCEITGAEAAIVVNNNAAAVLLVLNALAKGKEVVVSRGELVEIGGQFRIPDVMELSGARLVEVGTTNKTRLSDYENAVNDETKAFLKVHTSNYRIVGFTETVETAELCKLREQYKKTFEGCMAEAEESVEIPVIEDLGSGALIDLDKYGLPEEPMVRESIEHGADVVCFSGDKLLGGPQAGVIVGKKHYIEKMRSNPYYRAMRIGKLTAAVMERVLLEYRSENRAVQNIPVLRMMTKKPMDVEQDARKLKRMLKRAKIAAEIELYPCESQIGGGALPLTTIPSMAVGIVPEQISVEALEQKLRRFPVPVIGRIEKGRLLLDMRTFEMEYASEFVKQLQNVI